MKMHVVQAFKNWLPVPHFLVLNAIVVDKFFVVSLASYLQAYFFGKKINLWAFFVTFSAFHIAFMIFACLWMTTKVDHLGFYSLAWLQFKSHRINLRGGGSFFFAKGKACRGKSLKNVRRCYCFNRFLSNSLCTSLLLNDDRRVIWNHFLCFKDRLTG